MSIQKPQLSPPSVLPSRSAEWILLLVAFIWGGGFVGTQGALDSGLPPLFITALRFSIASILFYIAAFHRLRNLVPLLIPGLITGCFLGGAFILQTIGLQYTTPSKNAFLTSTNIIFVPFIYFFLTGKRIKKRIILSVILAIIGIGLLTLDRFSRLTVGDILTLLCAVLFAFHIYYIGYYVMDKGCDVAKMVFLQFLVSAVISTIAALSLENLSIPSMEGFAYVAYLALFSTLIAFFLQNSAQRHVAQPKAALLMSTEGVFGTLLSVIIVKERLNFFMIIGFSLLFISILIALDLKNETA